jgi:hypothetical protein
MYLSDAMLLRSTGDMEGAQRALKDAREAFALMEKAGYMMSAWASSHPYVIGEAP